MGVVGGGKYVGGGVGGKYVGAGVDKIFSKVVVVVVVVRGVVVVVVVDVVVVILFEHEQSQSAIPVAVAKLKDELSPSSSAKNPLFCENLNGLADSDTDCVSLTMLMKVVLSTSIDTTLDPTVASSYMYRITAFTPGVSEKIFLNQSNKFQIKCGIRFTVTS